MLKSDHKIQTMPGMRRNVVALTQVTDMIAHVLHGIDAIYSPHLGRCSTTSKELMTAVKRLNREDLQPRQRLPQF